MAELVITVEWKKNRMGGLNPSVRTNKGFVSKRGAISGTGYDKLSTATAMALNSDPYILNTLKRYIKKNKKAGQSYRDVVGYGLFGDNAKFAGGVGVSSHKRILERIGFEMRQVTSTPNVDVFIVKRKRKLRQVKNKRKTELRFM